MLFIAFGTNVKVSLTYCSMIFGKKFNTFEKGLQYVKNNAITNKIMIWAIDNEESFHN